MNVRVLGRGKLGRALHKALRQADVASTLHKGHEVPPASGAGKVLYVLAVPDAQIRATSLRVASRVQQGDVVVHCAGSRGPEELDACRRRGASVATVHPLVSFASASAAPDLHHTTWVARGDKLAIRAASKLARSVGARCVEGPAGDPVYHAAAAVIANGSAALADLTVRMLQAIGMDRKIAEAGVAGLLRTVASNVERVGVPAALTGPVVRGDAETVRSHVFALEALEPALAQSYVALVPLILTSAEAAGLSARDSARVQAALAFERTQRTQRTTPTSKGKPARPRPR